MIDPKSKMRREVSWRWMIYRLDHTTGHPLTFNLLINNRDLIHFYKWEAEMARSAFADPRMWGIRKVKIILEPVNPSKGI